MARKRGKIETQVLYCLDKYENARNSDAYLTNAVWVHFYKEFLVQVNGEWMLPLKNNGSVASRDDIKRWRARIQNEEKKFVPTNKKVALQRKWKEEEWREALGYNPELRTV